jgi:ABC-type uncharacterized transport system permease subunit
VLSILASFGRFAFPRREAVHALSLALAWLGAMTHLAAIVGLGLAEQRFPVENLGEAFSFFAFLAVAVYLALYLLYRIPWMSMLVLPVAAVLLLLSPHMPPPRADAPLQGPLFFAHTMLVLLASALLLGHVIMSLLYIAQEARLKAKRLSLGSTIPSLSFCDRLGVRMLGAGFLSLTFGILTGALWAAETRGHFFAWKFPEIFALLTWFIFGVLFETRLAHGWRGRKPALWSLVGFSLLLAVFVGVTLT